MAQPAQAHDPDALRPLGAASVRLQGPIHGDAAAEHGRGLGARDGVGDLDDEVAVAAPVVAVAALGDVSVLRVGGVVRVDVPVEAVLFQASGAGFAGWAEAGAGLGADADAVADSDVLQREKGGGKGKGKGQRGGGR